MSLTLGLTGMDPATETALKSAFAEANASLGGRWQLVTEDQADHVVVDMDSMYGPMSWLKLHAAGKTVIGLTSAPRTQTDLHLPRPCTAEGLVTVLDTISARAADPLAADALLAAEAAAVAPGETPAAATVATAPPRPAIDPTPVAPPSGMTPAPQPQDQLPEEQPLVADEESVPPPTPAPPAPARDPVFADWMAPGALSGRLRYQRDGGPMLLIDAGARQYHGPTVLKPLAGYFDGTVHADDFTALDDAAWAAEAGKLGESQPLARLAWYGGLLAGRGRLLPGFDPADRYRLTKWPQTEREFPKHFRIATAMMKGPATLAEIAEASGVPPEDVTDFVNASLATGFAELYVEPPPEPTEATKSGLFGRLRGR